MRLVTGARESSSTRLLRSCFSRKSEMLERYLHIRLKDEIRFRRFLRTKKSCHNPFNVRHQEQAYGQSRPVDLDFFIEMEDEESVLNYDPKRGGR